MAPSHQRAKEIFLAALEHPVAERGVFVTDACGDDEELRRDVESLLEFHDEEPTTSHAVSSADPFEPGDVVTGRYRMVTRLGRGGMGDVWRAEDLILQTAVALKVIHATGPEARLRVLNEVRLARQITHPSVCRVFDVGEAEDGAVFYTMELVEGEDLAARLRRVGRLPPETVADTARQLCGALAAAHVQGVLHRDLKPANILIDDTGRVRITDFGVAVLRADARQHTLTGTPGYMAPEQRTPGAALSERTDVYALGIVLYELLVGCHPFRDRGTGAIPPAPSTIVRNVDPRLDRLIMQALAADPAVRPASAAEFGDAVSFASERPRTAGEIDVPPSGSGRRRWIAAAAAGGLAAILAASLWLAPTHREVPTAQHTMMLADFQNTTNELLWTFGAALGQSVTLSIVGTSDVHGRVVAPDAHGGLALFGGYLRNLRSARATDGGAVILVDAGDMFQGTLESNPNEGAAMVTAYNTLGYTAAAIGNHEFDFGPVGPAIMPQLPGDDAHGALKARAAEARFPLLTANIIDQATGAPVRWTNVHPSTLVTVAGVKVGIIGVTSLETLDKTLPLNTRGLATAPLAPAITAEASRLRASGATVVIVASHAGGRCNQFDDPTDLSSCEPQREIMGVAQALPAGVVDVIVAGHSHYRMAHEVAGIAIIQAGENGEAFSRVDLTVDRATRKVTTRRIFPPQELRANVEYAGRPVTPDAGVAAAVAPAIAAAEALNRVSLGIVLDTALPKVRYQESALGNLFADALRASVPAEVALLNGGALRGELPAGMLMYGRLFEIYPFDDRVITQIMTGAQLRRIVAHDLLRPTAQITSISGVQVHAMCKSGVLDVQLTRPNATRVTDTDRLRVVVTDFMREGGDGILAPGGPPLESGDQGVLVRDVTADWLRRRGGRISESMLKPPGALRWNYEGERPVRCG